MKISWSRSATLEIQVSEWRIVNKKNLYGRGASPLLNARFRIVGCKDNTAVPTIIVETTVPSMVAGIRVSITVFPITLVRTVVSIRLA